MANKLHEMHKGYYAFHCPGCKSGHMIPVSGANPGGANWDWNGSLEKPTFNPSLLLHSHPQFELPPTPRCHSFVRDGKIMFLPDCSHELAGKTVEIPDWED